MLILSETPDGGIGGACIEGETTRAACSFDTHLISFSDIYGGSH